MTTQGTNLTPNTSNQIQIHKRWHKRGFISLSYWGDGANKVIVEIGETADKGLVSATKCYIPADQFLIYLKAEWDNQIDRFYPKFASEGLAFFGGAKNPPIARVFKITYYPGANNTVDTSSRRFACFHFEGVVSGEGIIQPKYDKLLSDDFIKISMLELAQIYVNLEQIMIADRIKSSHTTDTEADNYG